MRWWSVSEPADSMHLVGREAGQASCGTCNGKGGRVELEGVDVKDVEGAVAGVLYNITVYVYAARWL